MQPNRAEKTKRFIKKKAAIAFAASAIIFLSLGLAWLLPASIEPASVTPQDGSNDVPQDSKLTVNFDKPLRRAGLSLLIEPQIEGEWSFDRPLWNNRWYRTLAFRPDKPFSPETTYRVTLEGIRGILNSDAGRRLQLSFTTIALPQAEQPAEAQPDNTPPADPPQQPTPKSTPKVPSNAPSTATILNVPLHFQEKPLSCEAAALKMTLNYKGVATSENDIMAIVGFDPTPRSNNIWGDPNQTFVGSITGKQNSTGYGVHWGPIARAANHYRSSEAFSGWSASDLAREIQSGNPVIIWGTFGNARPDSWTTPQGKRINAWYGEHTRVVIGFRGPADNPTGFILNDPLAGRLNWTDNQLSGNWGRFSNSGVAVR